MILMLMISLLHNRAFAEQNLSVSNAHYVCTNGMELQLGAWGSRCRFQDVDGTTEIGDIDWDTNGSVGFLELNFKRDQRRVSLEDGKLYIENVACQRTR